VVPVIDCFETWGMRLAGPHTFANSAKHVDLYQRFGFWPQYLTAIMPKPVDPVGASTTARPRYSGIPGPERTGVLADCASVTDAIFEGLDVGVETSAFAARISPSLPPTWTVPAREALRFHCAGVRTG
jgi:hypothetical protein